MTSLVFPTLRRTLTDVMEDELYHIPSGQQQQVNQQGPTQFSTISSQQSANQDMPLQFTIPSPITNHTRLFRNPSAMNSEEMLTIPDHHHHNPTSLTTNTQSPLSRINSRDLYYDIPEPILDDHTSNAFNSYADPSLTTTNMDTLVPTQFIEANVNQNSFPHPFSFNGTPANCELDGANQDSKLVKFNDDYGLEYFQSGNYLDEESYGKFIVFDNSPDMIPEQLEDEDISDDEDGPYYLDHEDIANLTINDSSANSPLKASTPQPTTTNTTNTTMSPALNQKYLEQQLSLQEQKQQQSQSPQAHMEQYRHEETPESSDDSMMFQKKFSEYPYEDYEVFSNDEEDMNELGSDIDRMSLDTSISASSDDEREVGEEEEDSMDEEDLLPSFKPVFNSKSPSISALSHTINSSGNRVEKKSRTSSISKSFSNAEESHQCQLINPVTKKPCLKVFSRPYDLIRHQETLHAPSKKIFRCMVCNQLSGGKAKKSFSRCDALSRHIKIKHGLAGDDVEFAMKYARDNVEYIEYK
ncbi:hypothetical protein WICPIJ_004130 [Wickerhamomyces pijperi]|uniref:C2H2-type domain-containing protein n=2 Tax=Wickerhamomyces TaxID=599737 RepID=A0A9P8Q5U8_WICPI|nr:hypothetical protein WICPIJ_004130 [Wickerhamomyces pijperi]